MRHQKSGRALGIKPAHRRAMLRNMVTSLVEHQRIKTTLARAKELRTPLDKMITLGKKGDLASRRKALSYVKSKLAMASLFGEFAERYKDRNGGYSRILTLGPRRGDGALMALVILVDSPDDPFAGEKKPARRRRGGGGRKKPVLDEVAAEVSSESPAEAPEEENTAPSGGEEPSGAPAEPAAEAAADQAEPEADKPKPRQQKKAPQKDEDKTEKAEK